MKLIILFLSGSVFFLFSCNSTDKKDCDYIVITQTLLKNIKKRKIDTIRKMMAFDNKEFWSEGDGDWELIEKNSTKYLDTISNLGNLKYNIIYTNDPTSYAVVTVLIHQDSGNVKDIIEVRFLHPESPFPCKIAAFNYRLDGASNKIKHFLPDSLVRKMLNK